MPEAPTADGPSATGSGTRFSRLLGGYLLGRFAVQIFSLLAVPFYVRALGPARYSQVEVLTVALFATQVGVWGIVGPAALRLGFDRDGHDADRLWSGAIAAAVAFQSALAGLVLLAHGPITRWIGGPDPFPALVAAAACLPLFILQQATLDIFAARRRSGAFALAAISGGAVAAAGAVLLVVVFGWGAGGVLTANAVGYAVSTIVGAVVLGRSFWHWPSWVDMRAMAAYGGPLVPGNVALWTLSFADRFVLLANRSAAEVGRYAAAYRVGTVLLLLITALNSAWTPSLLAAEAAGDGPTFFRRGVVATAALMMSAAAGVSVLAEPVLAVFAGPAFRSEYHVVPWVAVGVALLALVTPLQSGLIVEKQTARIAAAAIGAAVVNVVACLLLIPPYGGIGAGAATATSYLAYVLITAALVRRSWHTAVPWAQLATTLAVPMAVAFWAADESPAPIPGGLALAAVAASAAVTFVRLGVTPRRLLSAR